MFFLHRGHCNGPCRLTRLTRSRVLLKLVILKTFPFVRLRDYLKFICVASAPANNLKKTSQARGLVVGGSAPGDKRRQARGLEVSGSVPGAKRRVRMGPCRSGGKLMWKCARK